MTTALALETAKGVVVGFDSLMVTFDDDGNVVQKSVLPSSATKLVNCDDYAIVVAGDARALNLLQFCFDPPPLSNVITRTACDKWLATVLVPSIKELFEDNDYAVGGTSDKTATYSSQLLVATPQYAYVIEGDYGWAAERSGIYAIGTGSEYAMGACHALKTDAIWDNAKQATSVVEKAIKIAASLDPYTGGVVRTHLVKGD